MAFSLEDLKNFFSTATTGTTPTSMQQPPVPLAPSKILDQGFQKTRDILARGGILTKQPETVKPSAVPALTPDIETAKPFVPRPAPSIEEAAALNLARIRPSEVLEAARMAPTSAVTAPEAPRTPEVFRAAELGIPEFPTREELLAKVPQFKMEDILKQPKIQLETLASQILKQQTDEEAARKTIKTREDFGQRGLFFSGAREGAEKVIQEEALADKLKIDVRFAGILIDAFEGARKESVNAAEKLLNEAKEGRREAIAQVNKLGFAVLPNGNVVETPAEIRAETGLEFREEQALLRNELNQAKFEAQQAKTASQQELAQERLQLAISRLELAQARFERGKVGPEDIDRYARDVLTDQLSLGGVPQEIRTEVSQRMEDLRLTLRTLTDEEIRAFVRSAQRNLLAQGIPTKDMKQAVKDSIALEKKLTEADKTRFQLILNEIFP